MLTFRRCCDRPVHSRTYSAWIIGTSLGAVLISIGWQLAFGRSLYSLTLLYAAFPLALTASEQMSRHGGRPPLVRGLVLILSVAAVYGFFLAVTLLADAI